MIKVFIMILQCQRNSFQKEFTATVKSCQEVPKDVSMPEEKGSKIYQVILEDTILFPGGGGQPSDRGWLNDEEVIKLERRGEDVVHFVKSPFTVGQTVKQKVDWESRFDRMQQHTGQHLITAIANKNFGFNTTAWCFGDKICRIELESSTGQMMTEKEMKDLEKMVNERIQDALPIVVNVFEENEPPPKSVRGLPKDHKGQVRVVTISGIEDNMCCGTHLAHLGQLQAIKLLSVERVRGKGSSKSTRLFFLYFVAGNRVLSRLQVSLEKESLEKVSNFSTAFNSSNSREIKTSQKQLELLCNYMERHPDLAHGRLTGISAKAKGVAMWEELTTILNSCKGGPKKPAYKWQKTWCDWKSYTKRKSVKLRKSQEGSEGSTSTSPALSFLESRLLALLEPEETDEDTSLPEAGIPPEIILEEEPTEEIELPDIDPQPSRPSLRRKSGEDMMFALVNVEEKRLKIEEKRREVEYRNVEALMGIGNSIHRFAEAMERIATCFEGYLSDKKRNIEK